MALHPAFPASPYSVLPPAQRWFRAAEELPSTAYEKLLPPRVARVRESVAEWRGAAYRGASQTSHALFHWWFDTQHQLKQAGVSVGFPMDYLRTDGELSTYSPDFIVRTHDGQVWVVETKGREEPDQPRNRTRLAQWCPDASAASGQRFGLVYVYEEGLRRYRPDTFAALLTGFRDDQEARP